MPTLSDLLAGQSAIEAHKDTVLSLLSTSRSIQHQLQFIEALLSIVYLKAVKSESFDSELEALKPALYTLNLTLTGALQTDVSAVSSALPSVQTVIETILDGWTPPETEE